MPIHRPALLLLVTLLGCAASQDFAPVELSRAPTAGESPRAELLLATGGEVIGDAKVWVEDARPIELAGEQRTLLHVVLQLQNRSSEELRLEGLPPEILAGTDLRGVPDVNIPDEGLNFTSVVSQLERELILRCLQKTGGNKRQAARLLQLSRTTFIDKMQRLNVAPGAA